MKIKCLKFSAIALSTISVACLADSVPNRILVKFKGGAIENKMMSIDAIGAENLQALGVANTLRMIGDGVSVMRYSTNLTPKEAAQKMAANGSVEWAQPDYILSLFPQPKVDELSLATGIDSVLAMGIKTLSAPEVSAAKPAPSPAPALPATPQADPMMGDVWGLARIDATSAWDISKGSKNIIVADIDTGIDYNHEDLMNNLWNGIGYDFVNNDELPFDDNEHGSHTAGTIGAVGGNGIGVSGVNQQVSLMALKFISSSGSGTTSDAVRAIDFAIAHGARVMSNSWGGPADDSSDNKVLEDAVERANQADILFVAASGNDGADNDATPVYPAAIRKPNMLTVASTSPSDKLSFFSNYGSASVHVAAPGAGILSTTPGNQYTKLSGTSMACPHVAGLAALILSVNPALKATQVKQIIMDSVDVLPSLQGKTVTGGRVNAKTALEKARSLAANQ